MPIRDCHAAGLDDEQFTVVAQCLAESHLDWLSIDV
jgi:hypothetical protein